jgi:hypothetical protein
MFDQPLPNGPDDDLTPDDIVAALIEEDAHKRRVIEGAEYELFKREVRRTADALERKDDRKPVWRSLTEQLRQPLQDQVYSIDRLLPLGGNALFAGRYKAGKTTFNGQLIQAWADRVPFLGQFDVHPDPDKPVVTIFNYEMSEDQMQRWLMKVGINNTDLVNVVHLRGLSYPLALPEVRAELAARLADSGTGLWVVDPASRAFSGSGDVNSNSDVATWLGWLDEVKLNAGVRDLVLNIHMGHAAGTGDAAAERAIGAQAWSAWADALWFLNFEAKTKNRQFWASGRDVEVEKQYVHYNDESMGVILLPNPPSDDEMHDLILRNYIMLAVKNNDGISQQRILKEVRGQGGKGKNAEVIEQIDHLAEEGYIVVQSLGRGRPTTHHLAEDRPYLPQPLPTSPQ